MDQTSSYKVSVLLVEDDTAIIRVLSERLEREGITVYKALDGVEGLEQATKHHPTLILLDVIMPRMDGFTMLKKLREDTWGKTAEVIMLTNLGQVDDVEVGMKYGAREYLIKSDWKIGDVVNKVKEKLGL